MGFRLNIDTKNAAFSDDARQELARILRDVAGAIERHPHADAGSARDYNGNTVGGWTLNLGRKVAA